MKDTSKLDEVKGMTHDAPHPAMYYCPRCDRFVKRGLLTCHEQHEGAPACGIKVCYECQRQELVSAAALAVEMFGEDELEMYARERKL